MFTCLFINFTSFSSFRDHPIPSMPWGVLPQIHRCRVIRGTGASHQHGDLVEHGTYKVAATTKTYQGLFWILKSIRLCLDHWKWLRATVTDEPWISDDVRCQKSVRKCQKSPSCLVRSVASRFSTEPGAVGWMGRPDTGTLRKQNHWWVGVLLSPSKSRPTTMEND